MSDSPNSSTGTGQSQLSIALVVFAGAAALLALGSVFDVPNANVSMGCLVALAVCVALLFRPGEPPVLLFVVLYQWLQVSTEVFHADFLGMTLDQFMPWIGVEPAVWAGLFSLVALALGARIGAGSPASDTVKIAIAEAHQMNLVRLVQLHFAAMLLVELLFRFANFGSLSQAIIALSQLRLATLFAVGYVALVQRRGIFWFALLCGLEVLQSLGGFFAGFRLPIYVAFLAAATSTARFDARRIAATVILAVGALYLGIVWQAIKGEYRDVANLGSGQQSVDIDRGDQLSTLTGLWGEVNSDVATQGVESLARRIAYVDFLAFTMAFVPNTRPHENGEIWWTALRHVAVPRLVWPEKPELYPDTEFTRDYTGLSLYSANRDTSISIGWVGDAYIDFGQPGMYAIAFVVGLLVGWVYRTILAQRAGVMPLRFGLVVAVILTIGDFGLSSVKLLGGLLSVFIVSYAGALLTLDTMSRWLTHGRLPPLSKLESAAGTDIAPREQ